MRYGQATSAIASTRVGAYPQAALTRTGFTPPPQGGARAPAPAQARTGAVEACNTQSLIFMGMDTPVNLVPLAAPGPPLSPGSLDVNFTPCEPVVIVDFELTDPSGKLLISNIRTCRNSIFEGGFLSVNALQSASTSRVGWTRSLQRLILMQTVPLIITFRNPLTVGNPLDVQGGILVVPIALNQMLPPETEAALARYNQ